MRFDSLFYVSARTRLAIVTGWDTWLGRWHLTWARFESHRNALLRGEGHALSALRQALKKGEGPRPEHGPCGRVKTVPDFLSSTADRNLLVTDGLLVDLSPKSRKRTLSHSSALLP